MPTELIDKKITQGQADKMMAPLELDLWALFRVMKEDMLKLSEGYEGTPEQFIDDVLQMLSEDGGKVEKSEGKMPEPKSGEIEQEFVSRCIPVAIGEGLTQEQAAGKCYGIFRNAKKSMIKKALVAETSKLVASVLKNRIEKSEKPVGSKSQRADGTYQKQPNGEWKKLSEGNKNESASENKTGQFQKTKVGLNVVGSPDQIKYVQSLVPQLYDKFESHYNNEKRPIAREAIQDVMDNEINDLRNKKNKEGKLDASTAIDSLKDTLKYLIVPKAVNQYLIKKYGQDSKETKENWIKFP